MGDPISRRQAVINEIQKAIEEIRHNGERHAEFVRVNGELVIAGLEIALDILNSTEPEPCDDTISRQAAIDALMEMGYLVDGYYCEKIEVIDKDDAIETIMTLPSTQLERKTGKWEMLQIPINPPVYKCSVCGRHAVWITTGCLVNRHEESYLSDFCPSCGADMRGEQNEQPRSNRTAEKS